MKKYSFIFYFIFITSFCICQENKTLGAGCSLSIYRDSTAIYPLDTLTLCSNDTFQLVLQIHGNPNQCIGALQWQKNGINIIGATTRTITVKDTGSYFVNFSGYGGGYGPVIVIPCIATSVKSNSGTSFLIFPNPVNDKLVIQNVGFENATIEIYNSLGAIFLTKKLDTQKEELDLSFLENGVYYISLDNGKGITRQTIIKNAH